MTGSDTMTADDYGPGYYQSGEGSNYYGYGDDPGWPGTARILYGHAPDRPMLLDVGCAHGFFVRAAQSAGFDAVGIDLSDWAVSQAPPEVKGKVMCGTAQYLPWPDDTFDVVCSWEFLEHVPEWCQTRVVDEMLRVLRPDGMLVHRIGMDAFDSTHRVVEGRPYWEAVFDRPDLSRWEALEGDLDSEYPNRDWRGRFFAYVRR